MIWLTAAAMARLDGPCEAQPRPPEIDGTWLTSRRQISCTEPIERLQVVVDGLSNAPVDVLLTVRYADGAESRQLLTSTRPRASLVSPTPRWTSFFRLGLVHLLEGLDHVLLVVGLALLLGPSRRLFGALTTFTAGHSVTLAVVALGGGGPAAWIEVAIALSLVWLALELVVADQRPAGSSTGFLARRPGVLGFGIGLLHGAGFGGALVELGLPRQDVVGALLLFNIGIEVGQLIVVAGLGLLIAMAGWLRRIGRTVPAYGIGSVAMMWVIERLWGALG